MTTTNTPSNPIISPHSESPPLSHRRTTDDADPSSEQRTHLHPQQQQQTNLRAPPQQSQSLRESTSTTSAAPLASSLSSAFRMLKFWPLSVVDQLTPKATPDGHERNPFDALPSPTSPGAGPRTPGGCGFQTHHLLNTNGGHRERDVGGGHSRSHSRQGSQPAPAQDRGDLTPIAPGAAPPVLSLGSQDFASAIPTNNNVNTLAFSLHVPDKSKMQLALANKSCSPDNAPAPPPSSTAPSSKSSSSSSGSASSAASAVASANAASGVSRGQLHVKLIQARGLNVASVHARPYAVVQFEKNEFVSRDPIHETEKEVKGVAMSRNNSSIALSTLGAINSRAVEAAKRSAGNSANTSPQSSVSSGRSGRLNGAIDTATNSSPVSSVSTNGLFGRLSAHNPAWKHEVTL